MKKLKRFTKRRRRKMLMFLLSYTVSGCPHLVKDLTCTEEKTNVHQDAAFASCKNCMIVVFFNNFIFYLFDFKLFSSISFFPELSPPQPCIIIPL